MQGQSTSGNHGLTLGKYAPLHAGHQLVIETALAEMETVAAVIYDSPEITTVPLPVRAGWLRSLYPQLEVIEAWDGPAEVGDTPEIMRSQEDYLLKLLGPRRFTHFYSSEFYGGHVSRALGAVDRRVDPERRCVPVSASQIRQDPFALRRYLSPRVYRDLIANVVLLGAPATGKTTLATELARRCATVWMPEYGREYWEQHQHERRLTPDQLLAIARIHLEREDQLLLEANRVLFTDTSAITTLIFARYYHGCAAPELEELAARATRRYDLTLVCGDEIEYDDTADRSGAAVRGLMQRQLLAYLQAQRIPYYLITGSLEQRAASVLRLLDGFDRYSTARGLPGGTADAQAV